MNKKLIYFVALCLLSSCMAEQTNPLVVNLCPDGIDNQIIHDGVSMNLTASDYLFRQETGRYLVFIYKNQIAIAISFYVSEMPAESTAFPITSIYDQEPDHVSIEYMDSDTYNAISGKVYVIRKNNQLTVQFCSVSMDGWGPSNLAGKVLCDQQ